MSSYDSGSTGSPPQGYFPIPRNPTCRQILAHYRTNLPPVFQTNLKEEWMTRLPFQGHVGRIKNLAARPDGCVPPNALTSWGALTPDTKLPDIRRKSLGDIYYTRGPLCNNLNRSKSEYDLSDPYNRRKVLDLKEYSALHDPNCSRYFFKPSVLKLLEKQKLINEKGEVLCDVNEFNHYRSYLGALFCDEIRKSLTNCESVRQLERNICNAIRTRERNREAERQRQFEENSRRLHEAYERARIRRGKQRVNLWKRKLQMIEMEKEQLQMDRSWRSAMKDWSAYKAKQRAQSICDEKKANAFLKIAKAEAKNLHLNVSDNQLISSLRSVRSRYQQL